MTPYGGLSYFLILTLVLLPALVLGLMGRNMRCYGFVATLALLLVSFDTWRAKVLLAAFWLWQAAVCYGAARLRGRGQSRRRFWSAVLLTLAPLAAVKVSALMPGLSISFLGVSYMTFRALDVQLEIQDGRLGADHFSLLDFSYFVLFAPAVSSGPLDRYRRFQSDIQRTFTRAEYLELARDGIWRLMTGALYYFVFGSLLWNRWILALPETGLWSWVGYFYGYTFYMFFNFAGYSRMAVGTAYLLGIRLPDNFNRPFLSVDMKDFWSRWHISLSTFLRDHVYTRFCMAALRGKWFKGKRTSSYLGYLLTMGLMGVWHGLSLHYVVYGLYHGGVMCLNELLDTRWKAFKKLKRKPWPRALMVVVTFHLFAFGLLLFSGKLLG